MTGEDDNPQDLAHLLPFYVNGTLGADERARVRAALLGDAALRRELEAVRALRRLVREGGSAITPEPRDRELRLRRILARLGPQGLRAWGAPLERGAPRRLSWKVAFAASAAVVVAQTAVIAWQATGPQREPYGSLAGPATPRARADLLVTPAADASWSDVQALLAARDLQIVGGPRDGRLDLAVPDGASPETEAEALRASRFVDFAGVAG